jgi:hypothetical protein
MKVSRLPLLAFLLPLLLAGLGQASAPLPPVGPEALGPAVYAGAPRQSIPQPVHNEATCAFCQAVAFTPYVAQGSNRLPERLAVESPEHLSSDDRLVHSGLSAPPNSRAPPLLRAA